MEQPLILAIDIGSSSVRAALYDANARQLPGMSVRIQRSFISTPNGGSELDAQEAFSQVVEAIDEILKKAAKLKAEIKCVASCAFIHSLVGVDARGKPTTKILGWADTRSRNHTAVLKKRFDENIIHNRTGAHFHSSFWPAKLLWLRKEFPDVFAKTAMWLSFSDLVALRLFGEAATSLSMASATGIFDIRKCTWDIELVKFLKLRSSALPEVPDSDRMAYRLTSTFAKRWPRLKDALWFPAIGDGMADNIGAGCTTKKGATLMIGTSAAMRVAYIGEAPRQIPQGLWCYRIDRKRVIVGGALSDGGNLYQLIKTKFKLPANVDEIIAARGEVPDELIVMPFFFGERGTGYDETASGAILGLKPTHDGVDILHAAMEGVAFRLAAISDRLGKVAKFDTIVASGGALRASPVWAQIIANVLGRDLSMHPSHESSLKGAVIFALENSETIIDTK